MKSSRKDVRTKESAIPQLRFEDQRLTSFAGLVVVQRFFQCITLRAQLKKCFRHLSLGKVFDRSAIFMQLILHLLLGFRELRDSAHVDTTPPEVACTTDLAALWPPNHKMVAVNVFIDATDACTAPENLVLLGVDVSSDEPDDGLGDGDTAGDVNGQDAFTNPVDVTSAFTFNPITESFEGAVLLRAERDGDGDGRAYTIEAFLVDNSNNLAATSCVVVVPHDRRGQ